VNFTSSLGRLDGYDPAVVREETIQVTGIRCERCVERLAHALRDQSGIEHANANLMGHVTLAWDDDVTSRETLLDALSRAGFRELTAV
jgi:cation transport ATPase